MDDASRPVTASPWRYAPIAIVAAVAVAGFVLFGDRLSFAALAAHRADLIAFRDAHYLPAVLLFVAAYAGIVAFSLPGATIATLAGGFLFGLFPGVAFNVVAATLGAIGIFLAARLGFGDMLARRMETGARTRRLAAGLKENELSVLFLIRLVPVVPFFVANLLPALAGVSLGRFALTTFFGIMPGALVYTWVGAGLGEVFARGADAGSWASSSSHSCLGPLLAPCRAGRSADRGLRAWRGGGGGTVSDRGRPPICV
jgi:uncharacterized membrane protein YdjX (TVP38/TMEM64 family)